MAPFPETEIMTLKRLEVAIRKMDFKLLKDGAYKLHEKYHSGHRFEYIDLIEEIYANILNNDSIPIEIKDILVPTIEDILNRKQENSSFGFENNVNSEKRVSSLTSLSYKNSTADAVENKAVSEVPDSAINNSSVASATENPTAKAVEKEPVATVNEAIEVSNNEISTPAALAAETPSTELTPFSDISDNIPKENLNQPFQEFNSLTSIKEEVVSEAKTPDKVVVSEAKTPDKVVVSEAEENNLGAAKNTPADTVETSAAETPDKAETIPPDAVGTPSLGEAETSNEVKEAQKEIIQHTFDEAENTPPGKAGTSAAETSVAETPDAVGTGEAEKQTPDAVGTPSLGEAEEKTPGEAGTGAAETSKANPPIQSIRTITKPKQEEFEVERRLKTVSIFYGQENSKERTKNILKLKELISKSKTENVSLDETIKLIFEVKTQVNTNVAELRMILEQLKHLNNEVNLVTNSASSNLITLLKETDTRFSFMKRKESTNLNVVTMFGLSNMYSCSNCGEKFLNWDEADIDPFILSCPKCKGAMYSTLFTQESPNINYYNYAVTSLANSNVWLVMHPTLNDEFTINLFRTALDVSSEVKEIYIVDKDINSREVLRNTLLEILNNSARIKIDTQMGAMENFFNSIR